LAARAGAKNCVRELVEHWGASLDVADAGGFTPLLDAAYVLLVLFVLLVMLVLCCSRCSC